MSPSTPEDFPDSEIQQIDARFKQAGLRRNLRGKSYGVITRMRLERTTQQELIPAMPVPRTAPNGVQWWRFLPGKR